MPQHWRRRDLVLQQRSCPTLRPFSPLRRAISEHVPDPSLHPSLPVSPRLLDRLQVPLRLVFRVVSPRPDPRLRFCLLWRPAKRLNGPRHLSLPLVFLVIFPDRSDRPPR
ncbi:hypothetical protein PPTG_24721 [Phytophthora nicotianae INRA-310]|uniref:Uncharacterized protein n=1 Tax=Phytophthora nicotianae (strain INRA-310) TaxID=761204 RepID=W2PD58_PHYN3|nr:hypothetical protein PPTG_24721 [Phytophthora nicotianae INRA-310]ETM98148.1 hypothetical protein PPTG_24721 [Phytophthora nicotianae INRA-310]